MTSAVLPRRLLAGAASRRLATTGVIVTGLVALAFGSARLLRSDADLLAAQGRGRLLAALAALGGLALVQAPLVWSLRQGRRRLRAEEERVEQKSLELSAARDEVRTLRAQLVAAERTAVGEMAGAVAHGIRNPLANIRAS